MFSLNACTDWEYVYNIIRPHPRRTQEITGVVRNLQILQEDLRFLRENSAWSIASRNKHKGADGRKNARTHTSESLCFLCDLLSVVVDEHGTLSAGGRTAYKDKVILDANNLEEGLVEKIMFMSEHEEWFYLSISLLPSNKVSRRWSERRTVPVVSKSLFVCRIHQRGKRIVTSSRTLRCSQFPATCWARIVLNEGDRVVRKSLVQVERECNAREQTSTSMFLRDIAPSQAEPQHTAKSSLEV